MTPEIGAVRSLTLKTSHIRKSCPKVRPSSTSRAMKSILCLLSLPLFPLTALARSPQVAPPPPADTAGEGEVTHTGVLERRVAIGGETTGWVLQYQTAAGLRRIEVDCSGLDAGKIPEGAVRITGRVIEKTWPERGPVLILKARKIEQNRRR